MRCTGIRRHIRKSGPSILFKPAHSTGPGTMAVHDEEVFLVFGDSDDDDDDEACQSCFGKGDGDRMLLCDDCNQGFHTFCLQPPLKAVPEGDWWCSTCRNLTATDPLFRRAARVRVYWADEGEFEGVVQEVRRDEDGRRSHRVYYGPGDEQWQLLVEQLAEGTDAWEIMPDTAATRAREREDTLVGSAVEVYFPKAEGIVRGWYKGSVRGVRVEVDGRVLHRVDYDAGDRHWHDLETLEWRHVREPAPPAAAARSCPLAGSHVSSARVASAQPCAAPSSSQRAAPMSPSPPQRSTSKEEAETAKWQRRRQVAVAQLAAVLLRGASNPDADHARALAAQIEAEVARSVPDAEYAAKVRSLTTNLQLEGNEALRHSVLVGGVTVACLVAMGREELAPEALKRQRAAAQERAFKSRKLADTEPRAVTKGGITTVLDAKSPARPSPSELRGAGHTSSPACSAACSAARSAACLAACLAACSAACGASTAFVSACCTAVAHLAAGSEAIASSTSVGGVPWLRLRNCASSTVCVRRPAASTLGTSGYEGRLWSDHGVCRANVRFGSGSAL